MKRYTIYTCGKMNGLSFKEQMDWRLKIEKAIKDVAPEDCTVEFIHPPLYFNYEYGHHKTQREVKSWELGVVSDKIDAIVVNLDGINDSVGSHYELATAEKAGRFIPIIGIGKTDGLHPWILESLLRAEEEYGAAAEYIGNYLLI